MSAVELGGIFSFILFVLLFTDWAFHHTRFSLQRVILNVLVAVLGTAIVYWLVQL